MLTYNALNIVLDRFHYDDTTVVHQLQTEVSGTPSMANVDLQSSEHIYRRFVRLCNQNADALQTGLF